MVSRNIVLPNSKSPTRQNTNLELIRLLDMKKVDEILVQQYCIRRFRYHHRADFDKLVDIRQRLDLVLTDAGLKNDPDLFEESKVQALLSCMHFLSFQSNRNLVSKGLHQEFRENLKKELKSSFKLDPMERFLNNEDIDCLTKILSESASHISDVNQRFNYLTYYSPFGTTNYVPGVKLIKHYLAGYHGKHSPRMDPNLFAKEALWLHSNESAADDQLSALVTTGSHEIIKFSSNVKILGHDQHVITVNGVRLENHLLLAIPTDQTPENIDESLRSLKKALMEALIDTRGAYHCVSRPDFDDSLFMSNFSFKPCFIEQWNQVRNRLVGLWTWDIANSDKTIAEAISEVEKETKNISKALSISESCYSRKSINNYYDEAVCQIGPRSKAGKVNSKKRKIDKYVTKDNAILGQTICT
jgi:hypothetical protein